MSWFIKSVAIFLGNTVGNIIPWRCYRGHWVAVASYNGNIVDGYGCPDCAAIYRS